MADKTFRLTFEMSDGSEQSVDLPIPQGEDGTTPHIGDNGNWWIGNTDTGIKAQGEDGQNGSNGKDGVSATHSWNGTTLTITSASGTSSANLKGEKGDDGYTPVKGKDYNDGQPGKDGTNGTNGTDGVSPTVSVSKSGKVTTVSITDKNGTKTATINDGSDGSPGSPGADGKNGTSVTVSNVSESSTDGGSNVVTFSDGKTVTIKNGKTGANGKDGTDATVTKEVIVDRLGYTPANVEDVFESALQPTFTNIFDTVPIEYGKMPNSDGTVSDTAAALATTDYIPIQTGDVIRMADFALYYTGSVRIAVYNSSKNFVTSVNATSLTDGAYYLNTPVKDEDGNVLGFTVSKPSTGFIRICTKTAVIGSNPVLTINEEIAYEVGYGTKLNPNVQVDYSQVKNSPQKNGWNILPNEHLNICYSSINRKPINTIAHFEDAATNFGYNCLKSDVRPTSDGELVCCHDAGLTFDSSGYITTYDSTNQTKIHDVTAATVLGYSFPTGEHPCLVGDYLDVCRKYGKIAFITIRNEYMDVVIPKLMAELKIHNMTHSAIINCMTYESLVQWREQDQTVMINYTLNYGVAIDQTQIDRAVGLGYCSLAGFSLSSSAAAPSASCDFEYARENGIRLIEAIAYHADSPEVCYDMGYDGCMIGIPWKPITTGGVTEEEVDAKIAAAISGAIGGSY